MGRISCFGVEKPSLFGVALLALTFATQVLAQEVIPDFYRDPGLYPNRSYVNQSFNEHIDPFTGSLQHHYVDLHIPGNGGFDLKVVRSYNSAAVDPLDPAKFDSSVGLGWTIHFGRVIKTKEATVCVNKNALSVSDNPVLELSDGSRQLLAFTGATSPLMLTTQWWRADCNSGGSGLLVYSPDGTRYEMTKEYNIGTSVAPVYAWYTTKITDRNGNYANISYAAGGLPQITGVASSDGRSISFSYADSGLASRRITSISGAGQTYSYNYQAAPGVAGKYLLSSVSRPGGTSWGYSYNGNLNPSPGSYLMRSASYPEGGSIDYRYDFVYFDSDVNPGSRSTVVASKSRSAGGSWGFRYTPGGVNKYDSTTVTTPSGNITYQHIGPKYATSGKVWMVGLLMSKTIGSSESETYVWGKQKISGENNLRPGAFIVAVDTGETNAPVLTQKTVSRDGASYTTKFDQFDKYGNPGTVVESGVNGGSRTTSLSYFVSEPKWIVKQVKNEVSSARTINREFDSNGNLTSIDRDGVKTTYAYDGQGNVSSSVLPRSLTVSYGSYKRGVAQSESQPEGVVISRVVNDAGNVTSETNGEGKTTTYAYDGLNRVTSIGYPTGSSVAISYGAASKTASRGSLTEAISYDGFGAPTSISLGGISRSYTYDALGRKTFESNPGSSAGTSFSYDILDRVTKVTNADGSSRSISYGAGTKTIVDERSKSTTFRYRAYGNPDVQVLMAISAPEASASITISRDSRDLITAVTQGGITRSFGYNSNGYLTSITNPETGVTSFGRDAAGNMTSRSVGSSGSTTYTYDGQNRLTSVYFPGGAPSLTNSYNKTHKLLTASSSTGTKSFVYDSNGNLTSESLVVDGVTLRASYTYNSLDQLSSMSYPISGTVVSYSPDVLGRPTAVSGYINSVSYYPSGQISRIAYANGVVSSYGQNSRLWPSSFVTSKTSGGKMADVAYGYDSMGNITTIGDAVNSASNRTMSYDGIGRLTGVSGPWGVGSITYSGTGNVLSQVFGGDGLYYSYDGSNRLSSVSGRRASSFTYDAYGNVVGGMGSVYTYDGVPNLKCVNCSDAANKTEYRYDATGARSVVEKAGVKTYEMYGANGNLLVEYTPSKPGTLREYIYLAGKRIAQKRGGEPGSSTTTLAVSPNPVGVGQTVTMVATVTGSSPTGDVSFKRNGAEVGKATLSGGKATFSTTFPVASTKQIVASYGGDAKNAASTSDVVDLVVTDQASTTTTLVVSPNPAVVNQNVTLVATVAGNSPTGEVSFKRNGVEIGRSSVTGGKASFSTVFPVANTKSIVASYEGDAKNAVSTSEAVNLVVTEKATSVTVLSATPNPVEKYQEVTLVATITGSNPTGTVIFEDQIGELGRGIVSGGRATVRSTFIQDATRYITAYYSGDSSNTASMSETVTLPVVVKTESAIDWLSNFKPPASVIQGQGFFVQAVVTGTRPTGTVTFKDGATALATVNLISAADPRVGTTLILDTAGSRTITMEYSGDAANLRSSKSTSITVKGKTAATIDWRSGFGPPARVERGTSFNVQAMITGTNPTGSVTFKDGARVLTTVNLFSASDSRVAATLMFEQSGTKTITMEYSGDRSNLPATKDTTITIAEPKAVATVDWRPGFGPPALIYPRQSFSAQVQVTGNNPTGGVIVYEGSVVVGRGMLISGSDPRAELSIMFTSLPGSKLVTLQYLGDVANFPAKKDVVVVVSPPSIASTEFIPSKYLAMGLLDDAGPGLEPRIAAGKQLAGLDVRAANDAGYSLVVEK